MTQDKSPIYRVRFKTPNVNDPRPIVAPLKFPYWVTGFGVGYAVIVAYADSPNVYVKNFWPEAYEIDSTEVNKIVFSDRFRKPDWYKGDEYGVWSSSQNFESPRKEYVTKGTVTFDNVIQPQTLDYFNEVTKEQTDNFINEGSEIYELFETGQVDYTAHGKTYSIYLILKEKE